MIQEHIGINVEEPRAMADWYCRHLSMTIVKDTGGALFIADQSGHGVLEIYNNPSADIPDYANTDPLIFHIAFVSKDVDADEAKLIEAGATKYKETIIEDGNMISILRDPWGLAIQLAKRAEPFMK